MELEAIPVNTLRELAKYLDEFPSSMPGSNEEEFWRLLIKKLPRQMYSRDQVEEFAEEVHSISGSPSLRLLYDMRGKNVVKFEQLLTHLKAIKCHKAINMFTPTKIPVFKEQPQSSVQTREGETVVLSCVVECVPSPPLYQWFHERTPLAHENNSHLILKNIHQGHNGLYCCRATNPRINNESEKHVFSKFTKLSVSQFPVQESGQIRNPSTQCGIENHERPAQPKVTGTSLMVRDIAKPTGDVMITKQPPSSLTIHYNENFELECNAMSRSEKKLTYKWIRTKPGQIEVLGSEPKLESTWTRAGTINIKCEITNEKGEKVSSREVQVKVITVWFTEQPQNIRTTSNKKVMLTCKAEGKTPVRFIWFNSSLRKSKKKIIPNSNSDVLVIDAATVHDTGFYSCQAEVEGDIVNSETVEVQVGDRKDFFIVRQPRSYVCVMGRPLTLSCAANGDPTYLWYHNDEPMEGEEAPELHIPQVTDETFGTYKCRVTGSGDDQEFTKTVKVEPGVSKGSQKIGMASIQNDQIQAEAEFKTASGMYYAREKLALLLGNQDYESDKIANLTSPINDITKLKEALEKLNFKVFAFANLRLEETNKVLNRFCELLIDAGMYAVFYYAGHGFEHQNVDYIMPVNAQMPLRCDECYSVNYIAAKLQERKAKVFMFLDSCRVSYGSLKVEGPTSSRQQLHCGFSNLYKVSSCVPHQPAFEKASDECSVFNKALREGLLADDKDLEEMILDTMRDHSQSKAGGVYQRPVFVNRLIPRKITLRDEILWDNMMDNESEMAEGENTWETVHSIPEPIDLLSKSDMVRGSVQFHMVLSNVMIVTAEFTARAGYMQPGVTLNTDKLRSQKVIVVQTCDEEGKASYRISDLERHRDGNLELMFGVSVFTSKVPAEEKQSHFSVKHRINKFK